MASFFITYKQLTAQLIINKLRVDYNFKRRGRERALSIYH